MSMSIRQKAQSSELPSLPCAPSKLFCCRSTLDAAHCPPAIAGQHPNQLEERRAFLFIWSISAFSRDSCLHLNARACSQPPPKARSHPGQPPTRPSTTSTTYAPVTAAQHELRAPRDAPEAHARRVCQYSSTEPRRADTATFLLATATTVRGAASAAAATDGLCASCAACREPHRARRAHHQQPVGPGQPLSSIGSVRWT
jgi:hypothetical protein